MRVPIRELFKRLKHKDARVRLKASRALDNLESADKDAVSELIEFLSCDDPAFCVQAARSLQTLGPKCSGAVPKLTAALSNKDSDLRFWALEALMSIGAAANSAVPEVTKLLQDEAIGVRQAAAEALTDLGPNVRSTVPALVSTLQNDPNSFVRESVVRALGQIGSKRAVAAVIHALNDRDVGVRWYATIELKVLGSDAKEAIPALTHLLRSETDDGVRDQAKTALRRMRYKRRS
jgi:HEAT repeat protein